MNDAQLVLLILALVGLAVWGLLWLWNDEYGYR